ncbi:MAG: hypothetical protein WBD74_10285 [Candidatus Aquilonibacter sp.]
MRTALCALLLALAVWPLAARADDYGPRRDIAAIRHDLPILVEATKPVVFDSFNIGNAQALVQWHVGRDHFNNFLEKRYGRWWLLGWGVSFTELQDGGRRYSPMPDPAAPFRGDMPFSQGIPNWATDGGYRVTLRFASNDAGENALITSFSTRIPTEAESWANQPSGNSYFFFSGTVQSPQPVRVQAGTIVDVWFPFVLDSTLHYSLTIAAPNAMSLGPVEGTLKDNTLHFVLPAFTAPPGADLMGEIDSD